MAEKSNTPKTFVSRFIIGNLHPDATLKEIYQTLELDKYPCKEVIELSLAVDKNGSSKGYAFLQIPQSCTKKLLEKNKCNFKDQPMKITPEKQNSHLMKEKKWLKSYKGKGLIQTQPAIPQTDSHQHLQEISKSEIDPLYDMFADMIHKDFAEDLDQVLARSYSLGVDSIVIPGRSRKKRQAALDLISQFEESKLTLYFSTGIGPSHALEYDENDQEKIEKECSMDTCCSIGPIGLDYRKENISKEKQLHVFEEQIKLACRMRKPIYLVEYNAHEDAMAVLNKYRKELPACAVVDFFGNCKILEKYLGMGFYIVISGSIKRDYYGLQNTIVKALGDGLVSQDRILLSSNAPKGTSVKTLPASRRFGVSDESENKIPQNGTRSEPSCIFATVELTAKHMGIDAMEDIKVFAQTTVKNSKAFLFDGKQKTETDGEGSKLNPETVNKINILYVAIPVLIVILAIFLQYMSGIPEVQIL